MHGPGLPAGVPSRGRATVTCPAPRDLWDDTLRRDPEALVTQSPAWIDAIADGPLAADELSAIVIDLRSQPALITRIRANPLHADVWSVAQSHDAIRVPRLERLPLGRADALARRSAKRVLGFRDA